MSFPRISIMLVVIILAALYVGQKWQPLAKVGLS